MVSSHSPSPPPVQFLGSTITFITWLVFKIRKKATKPNYAAVFFGVLIGVFFAYLTLVAMTDGGHSIPK
jgi:hypothetical protein